VAVSLDGNESPVTVALPAAGSQGEVRPHQQLSFFLPWQKVDNLPNAAVFGQFRYMVEYRLARDGAARVTGKTISFNQITRSAEGGGTGHVETVIKLSDEVER